MKDKKRPPVILPFEGRPASLQRVPLSDLAEWRDDRNLECVGAATMAPPGHEPDDWPPILLFRSRGDQ